VINRALEEASGTTAVHLCFGYAAIIHDRPAGYSFLPELAACSCDQISIDTAQSGLDCSVLATLEGKTIILGVLGLNDMTVESPETVMARVRRALPYAPPERMVLAPDCGMKYLPRDVAFGKLTALTEAATRLAVRSQLGQCQVAPGLNRRQQLPDDPGRVVVVPDQVFAAGMPVPMSRNCRIPASAARNRTTRARNARFARTEATMPG